MNLRLASGSGPTQRTEPHRGVVRAALATTCPGGIPLATSATVPSLRAIARATASPTIRNSCRLPHMLQPATETARIRPSGFMPPYIRTCRRALLHGTFSHG